MGKRMKKKKKKQVEEMADKRKGEMNVVEWASRLVGPNRALKNSFMPCAGMATPKRKREGNKAVYTRM